MMERRAFEIVMVNFTVIGLALAAFVALGSVQTLYPYNGLVTSDRTPAFEWSGWEDSYEILIDDDPSFSTPMTFDVSGRVFTPSSDMDFGSYWWKVKTEGSESESKTFSIVSKVEISRTNPTTVVNTGNTDLSIYSSAVTGAFTLGVNEELEIGEDDNVKAEQK